MEKGEIAQNEQFHLFPQSFLCNLYPSIATFQLSSAASLNLGQSQNGWLVGCQFNSYGHIMAVSGTYVFPGFLTPVLTQNVFPKPLTTFLTCFSRGERRKYAEKKFHPNRVLNSQPWGHESNTLTAPPGWLSGERVGLMTWWL